MSSAAPVLSRDEIAREWYDDPVAFCNDVFHQKPWEFQPEWLRAVRDHRRVALKACRQASKTATAAYAALWWLVTRPRSLVVTTAPTWAQVSEALWVEIRARWQDSRLPALCPRSRGWDCQTVAIRTPRPDWRAIGFTSDHPENLEGPHGQSLFVVYDESKGIPRGTRDSLQGMFGGKEYRELAIGTPGAPVGWFYDAFTSDATSWHNISVSGDQIPRLRPYYFERLAALGAESALFRREQKAEFAGAEEGAFFPLDAVERCQGLKFNKQATWRRVLGVDPAGTGSNETCLTYRWGPVVLKQEAWSERDEMRTVGEIVDRTRRFRPELVVVDKPGLGGPIISRLREVLDDPTGRRVRGFNPQQKAGNDEEYENFKTEIAFAVRERMTRPQPALSIPRDPELKSQLTSYQVVRGSHGRSKLVDPKTSPDRGDSLLIAFSPDLERESVVSAARVRGV